MRTEQVHFFLYGALLFAGAWSITLAIPSARLKLHLRAFFLALGLGFVVVPGHGEFIMAPILAVLKPPLRAHLLILGGVYFLIWWAAAFSLLRKRFHPDSKRRPS